MRIAFISCALAIAGAFSIAAHGQQYSITDLGPSSAFSFELAPGLSSNGMVTFGTGNAVVRWNQGVLTPMPQSNGCFGRGVNNAGTIAGWTPDNVPVAWINDLYNNLLGQLPNGPANGQAVAVNNSGHMIVNRAAGVNSRSYLLNGQSAIDLGTLGGETVMYDLNETDEIVGYTRVADVGPRAAVWRNGTLISLGTLGGNSFAYGISNNGTIVGSYAESLSVFHGYRYVNNQMTPLAMLQDSIRNDAYAVNDAGTIVGSAQLSAGGLHALLWQGNQSMDLNSLVTNGNGWTLSLASDINNAGQIVGFGDFNGQHRAFLLNPVPTPPTIAFVGLALMFRKRRRR